MRCLLLFALLAITAVSSAQVVLNQVDTFSDGTTMAWAGGAAPTNIASGGPLGAGDRYLQITSSGLGGPGGHPATFNSTQWQGNFTAAGVSRVEVDMRNTGSNAVQMRLVLFATSGDRWSSNVSVNLPANSPWVHASFDLTEANFTHTAGLGTWAATMSSVSMMMFRHEPTPSPTGTPLAAQVGFDNIAARPSTVTLAPSSFTLGFGFVVGGNVSSMASSDDSYLVLRQNPFRSRLDPAIQMDAVTTAPAGTYSRIDFTLESSTTAVPAPSLTQKIHLFNYNSNAWHQIDSRGSTTADSSITITVTAGVMNFINGNGEMKARVEYFDPGTLATRSWLVSVDQMKWVLSP